jgi:hypothetical protein
MNRRLHDQRIRTNGIPSPETGCMYPFLIIFSYKTFFLMINSAQTEQVRIVLDEMYRKNKPEVNHDA